MNDPGRFAAHGSGGGFREYRLTVIYWLERDISVSGKSMKHSLLISSLLELVVLLCGASALWAADDLGNLLDQLVKGSVEKGTLLALEAQPDDGRVMPALRASFARATSKNEKQWIASTLLRLGDQTQEYSDFLISSAREAIEDRTPPFADYDRDGNMIKGRFSASFEAWCQANGKDPRSVAALQFGTYPEDVLVLARAHDPNARELLRRALQSPNPLVVGYGVQGLGRLGDTGAISSISDMIETLPASVRSMISMNLPWFSSPDAALLMERLTPEPKARGFMVRQVQAEQLVERQNALHRLSKAPK